MVAFRVFRDLPSPRSVILSDDPERREGEESKDLWLLFALIGHGFSPDISTQNPSKQKARTLDSPFCFSCRALINSEVPTGVIAMNLVPFVCLRRVCPLAAVFLVFLASLHPQDKEGAAPPTYRAGGLSIAIPPPGGDLVEAGPDYRVVLEPLAPDANRLLAAFVLPGDMTVVRTGTWPSLTDYALVEIPRRAEFADVDADAFKTVVDGMSKQLGGNLDLKDSQEELNLRLKALNPNATVTLDKPLPLGVFFSNPDASGFGMIMPASVNGVTTRMVVVISVLRVQKRVLFAYSYKVFKDENTVKLLQATSEKWAEAICNANR
ncbi:MAG: hypothetical protein ACLPLZ_05870 [Terracidiphilus sp.]